MLLDDNGLLRSYLVGFASAHSLAALAGIVARYEIYTIFLLAPCRIAASSSEITDLSSSCSHPRIHTTSLAMILLSCFALIHYSPPSSSLRLGLRPSLASVRIVDIPQRIQLSSCGHSPIVSSTPDYEYYVFFIFRLRYSGSFPTHRLTGPRLFGYIHILDPSDLARVISPCSHELIDSAFVGDFRLSALRASPLVSANRRAINEPVRCSSNSWLRPYI